MEFSKWGTGNSNYTSGIVQGSIHLSGSRRPYQASSSISTAPSLSTISAETFFVIVSLITLHYFPYFVSYILFKFVSFYVHYYFQVIIIRAQ